MFASKMAKHRGTEKKAASFFLCALENTRELPLRTESTETGALNCESALGGGPEWRAAAGALPCKPSTRARGGKLAAPKVAVVAQEGAAETGWRLPIEERQGSIDL